MRPLFVSTMLAACLGLFAAAPPAHARQKSPCEQASQTAEVKKVCGLFKKYAALASAAGKARDPHPDWVKGDLGFLAQKLSRTPSEATTDKVLWASSNYQMLNDKIDANRAWVDQAGTAGAKAAADKPAQGGANKSLTCNNSQGDAQVMKACKMFVAGSACRANFGDTRYKSLVASNKNRFRELRALPSAGSATPKQIREFAARKDYGRFELQSNDCDGIFGVTAQDKQERSFGEKAADTKAGQWVEKTGDQIGKMSAKDILGQGCEWASRVANPWALIVNQIPVLGQCNKAMLKGFYCKAPQMLNVVAYGFEGLKERPKTCAAVTVATAGMGTLTCGTIAYVTPRAQRAGRCLDALYKEKKLWSTLNAAMREHFKKKTPMMDRMKAGCEMVGGVVFDIMVAALSGGGSMPNTIRAWITQLAKGVAEEAIPGYKFVTGKKTPMDEKMLGYLEKVENAASKNMPAACK